MLAACFSDDLFQVQSSPAGYLCNANTNSVSRKKKSKSGELSRLLHLIMLSDGVFLIAICSYVLYRL